MYAKSIVIGVPAGQRDAFSAIALFGGRGGVLRSALGVFVVAFMVNGLNLLAISTFIQEIIVGAIIILSVWLNSLHRARSRKRAA